MKRKLLLHICCAPCSASAVKMLQDEFDILFYWHNPNIYDAAEYDKRKSSAADYAKRLGIEFFEESGFVYDYGGWLSESSEQCALCYKIRLAKASSFAKNNNFDCFSTSLLSSPYQNHELVKNIASEYAGSTGIEFLYRDFRPGYYEGKNMLKQVGCYMQKYCGCAKSFKERFGASAHPGSNG